MPSSFVLHYTRPLSVPAELSRPPSPPSFSSSSTDVTKQTLRNLIADLGDFPSLQTIYNVASTFVRTQLHTIVYDAAGTEERALSKLIVRNLVVSLYTQVLDVYLAESLDIENELDWWSNIERSRWRVAYYLFQTLPFRLANAVTHTIHDRDRPFHLPVLTPSALFRSQHALYPSMIVASMFPHLNTRHAFNPSALLSLSPLPARAASPARFSAVIAHIMRQIGCCFAIPFELARQEVVYKRKELEKLRDSRAAALGNVAHLRTMLENALQDTLLGSDFNSVVDSLDHIVCGPQPTDNYLPSPSTTPALHPPKDEGSMIVSKIYTLAGQTLPSHIRNHETDLDHPRLRRPSRLVLVWPKLLFLPPVSLYGAYITYSSRSNLVEFASDLRDTIQGFLTGWILEPLKDVLNTVRAGSAQSIVIQQQAVNADLESLERMVLSLAKDHLNYSTSQLDELSHQIRVGDLTPVLKLYEEDIRSPLKSTITGTLLRTLFIQIQKAKVDIDQALSGIDHLLKSQELTFAFVGIAPGLGILYLAANYIESVWQGGKGRGRYGGRQRRIQALSAIRRIERLLTCQPSESSSSYVSQLHQLPRSPVSGIVNAGEVPISPMTTGLMLLSVTRLREFGERHLPGSSRLRTGFLEDVDDLENPALARAEKLRTVDRMWRSWGRVLGWDNIGGATR